MREPQQAWRRPYKRSAGCVARSTAMWQRTPPKASGRTWAQKAGLRYERKALLHLASQHPNFIDHLPFVYISEGDRKTAIPDGICFAKDLDHLTIIEIKLKHTDEAWHQLNLLYLPVVQRAFPSHKIKLLEVVRWYEPTTELPGKTLQVIDAGMHFESSDFDYGIYIWSDR